MLKGKNIRKSIEIFIIGCFFIVYLVLWFKQYTYFNYAGGELYFDDEELIAYASTAAEKEFDLAPEYSERVSRIVFWTNQFSEIDIVNDSRDTWQFTVSDYYGGDVSAASEPVLLNSGESFSYVADSRGDYVVSVYGRNPSEDTDGLCVRYSNQAYMNRWKKAAITALGLIAGISAVLCLWSLVWHRRFGSIAPYVCLSMGTVCVAISEYAALNEAEAYLIVLPQTGSFFLGIISLVCAQRQPEPALGRPDRIMCPYIWAAFAASIAFVFHFLMLSAGAGSFLYVFTGGENSGRRIAGYVVVFGAFIILYLCLGHIKLSASLVEIIQSYFSGRTAFLSLLLCILAVARGWLMLHPLFIGAYILSFIGIRYGKNIKIPKALRFVYYSLLTLLVAVNSCVINFWDTGGWNDVYHTGTFYHSLFFVAADQPFRGGLNQMYGHYGLFYKVPMLIFGSNMRTIGVTTAVFAAAAVSLALLSMDRILKSDVSRLVCGIVVTSYLIIDWLYLQTFPLRMLWAFALLYYCVLIKDKQLTIGKRLLGYLICTLAILWNTESGLVCAVCWAVCIVLKSEKKLTIKRLIIEGMAELMVVAAELFIAYSAVKMYNICTMTDGSALAEFLSWKKEVATSARSDAGDTSNGSLYWVNAPWMYIELALMGCVAVLLDRAGFFGKRKYAGNDMPLTVLVFYAAGIFIYWMGRPEEYNTVAPFMGCIAMVVYDYLINKTDSEISGSDGSASLTGFRRYFRIIAEVAVCLVVSCFLFKTPDLVRYTKLNLIDHSIADYGKVVNYLEDFDREVPAEADGEVLGFRMVCLGLGRDPEFDGLGWGYDESAFAENCREKEWILLNEDRTDISFLELEKEIHFGGTDYYLYHNESFQSAQ